MDIINVKTRSRTGSGKSYTRKARASGWIPAVYYGHGDETKHIEVAYLDFATAVRNRKQNHIFALGLEGLADSNTIIKEIQYNVVNTSEYYHIDFQHINMKEKLHVTRKVVLKGVCPGVKAGGDLDQKIHKMRLECLPADIPEQITVDISKLEVGETIHVSDIDLPGVTVLESAEEFIVTVHAPKLVEIAAAPDDAPATKGKKK